MALSLTVCGTKDGRKSRQEWRGASGPCWLCSSCAAVFAVAERPAEICTDQQVQKTIGGEKTASLVLEKEREGAREAE